MPNGERREKRKQLYGSETNKRKITDLINIKFSKQMFINWSGIGRLINQTQSVRALGNELH